MYAVIFKATMAEMDDEYLATAQRLRELAFEKYGSIHILFNDNARTIYNINILKSYDENCYNIIYENNKTNDIIYQINC